MKQLHPTKLRAIPVDINATEFKISGTNHLCEKDEKLWFVLFLEPLKGNFKILGTATKDCIDFDIKCINLTADEVYSLLKANECLFENPYPHPSDIEPTSRNHYNALKDTWQTAQQNVHDKYLIIEEM